MFFILQKVTQLKYTTYTPKNVCQLRQMTGLNCPGVRWRYFLTGQRMVNLKGLTAVTKTNVYNMYKKPTTP